MTKSKDDRNGGTVPNNEALSFRVDRHAYHSEPHLGLNVINLENPFDIRPAITATLAEIDLILPTLAPNQPLILLTGELHNRPSHLLLKLGLIHALHERGKDNPDQKTAVSYELPDKENLPEQIHPGLNFVVNNNVSHAPYTRKFFFHSMYQSDIPLTLSDLKRSWDQEKGKPILDMLDDRTRSIVQKTAPKALGNKIQLGSPRGMRLRNISIVEKSLEILTDTNAKILVFSGGAGHVLGHNKHVYNGSLDALFLKSAANATPAPYVMPIFIGRRSEFSRDFPEDTPLGRLRKSYWIEGLVNDPFTQPEITLASLAKLGVYTMAHYFNLHKKDVFSAERDFVKGIIKESGGINTFPHDPVPYGTIEQLGKKKFKERTPPLA